MSDEITVDDIQIGGAADVKWQKNDVSAVYPAVLQKSRVNKNTGVPEYRWVPLSLGCRLLFLGFSTFFQMYKSIAI